MVDPVNHPATWCDGTTDEELLAMTPEALTLWLARRGYSPEDSERGFRRVLADLDKMLQRDQDAPAKRPSA